MDCSQFPTHEPNDLELNSELRGVRISPLPRPQSFINLRQASQASVDPSSFEIMRPPSEIEGIASASDPHIDEAKSLYLLSVVDITEVDNNRSRHFLL